MSDTNLVRSCSTVPNSDHLGLQIDLSLRCTITAPKRHAVWRYKYADWERACDLINSTDWKALVPSGPVEGWSGLAHLHNIIKMEMGVESVDNT